MSGNSKVLVAYFSKTGEQYGVGNISKGNTAILAEIISDKTGADLFEIKVLNDNYPDRYRELTQYALTEKQNNERPVLSDKLDDIESYETVFLGYPNWWGDMPMPVYSFLEGYNFEGKKIYHFCTHEGSGGVTDGLEMYGHIAQNSLSEAESRVEKWLSSIGF